MPSSTELLASLSSLNRTAAGQISALQDMAAAGTDGVVLRPAPGDLRPTLLAAASATVPQVIELQAGTYTTGLDYQVPSKDPSIPIVIRGRLDAGSARIRGEWRHPSVGTGNYHFENLRLEGFASRPDANLITHGSTDAIDPLAQPALITYVRTLIDGGVGGYKRGILANSRQGRFLHSRIVNIFHTTADSQGICAYNGGQDWLVADSSIEGSTENVMLGGSTARSEAMLSQRWRFERCDFPTTRAFRTVLPMRKKNKFEIKAGTDIELIDCSGSGSWSDLQNGVALAIKVTRSGETGDWVRTARITVKGCTFDDIGVGIAIVGRNDAGGGVTQVLDGLTVERTAFACITTAFSGTGGAIRVADGPKNVTFRDVVFDNQGGDFLKVWGASQCEGWRLERVSGRTGPIGFNGEGVADGAPTVAQFLPGAVLSDVRLLPNSTAASARSAIAGVTYLADEAALKPLLAAGWRSASGND